MHRKIIIAAVALACLASPASIHAQNTTTPCADGTIGLTSDKEPCSGHGGVKKAKSKGGKDKQPKAKGSKDAGEHKSDSATEHEKSAADEKDRKSEKSDEHRGEKTARGATAKCKDGSYSHSKEHASACAKNGGVEKWMDGAKP